jgi:hypothetical protein
LPLSERARLEVYVPDIARPAYQELLDEFEREFCHTFGGATVVHGLDGSYLSRAGLQVRDRIVLLYSDLPFSVRDQFDLLSRYADHVRDVAFRALDEESILVAIIPAFHATSS